MIRDNSGNPLPNTLVQFRFTLENNSGSEIFYRETQSVSTNALGGVSMIIGKGIPTSGIFSATAWNEGDVRMRVELDPAGGNNFVLFGLTPLQSVPFALYAEQAASLSDVNGDTWFPEDDRDEQTLSVNGNQLSISNGNIVTLPIGSGGGDNWGSQTIETETELTGSGTLSSPLGIARQGAINGDVLKWNGSNWSPQSDNNQQYTAGDGISINGDVINNTGDNDNDADNEIQTLSINGNALSLSNGGSVNLPIINYSEGTGININGSSIAAENTQPLWNANQLQSRNLSATAPSSGQVLKWNGSAWAPDADNGQTYTAGTGITIAANSIAAQNTTALWNANQLRGFNVTTTTPIVGNYLQYSASGWTPSTAPVQPWQQNGNNIYFNTGNVGLGTSTPASKLHIFDEEKIQMDDQTFGKWASVSIEFTSNIVPEVDDNRSLGILTRRWTSVYATNGTINTSDIREKNNIKDLEYGLDELLQLRPVSFSWINRPESGTKLGLIAQEVEAIMPEVVVNLQRTPGLAVDGEADSDRLGMYYSDLIPVLIKAIQEQQERINLLEQEIALLKK